jgi:hypothetical protein
LEKDDRNKTWTLRQRNEALQGRSNGKGQRKERRIATYLHHLVQRRLVHAKLLKVILRRLDHLLDDLLVDVALLSLSAKLAFTRPRRAGCAGDH